MVDNDKDKNKITKTDFTNNDKDAKKFLGLSLSIAIFAIIWALFGFIAFIWSLVCFAKSGTAIDKIIGLLLAFFTGPFYFIYLIFYKQYCR